MFSCTMNPTSQTDPWHYPRPELAAWYLNSFEIGLVSARGLFAPRRMGKTEFLKQDLIPVAEAANYLTAYLNLWDARANPKRALISALTRAAKPSRWRALLNQIGRPLKKVKAEAKVGVLEGTLEAEIERDGASDDPLLSDVFRMFDRARQRLILVLDEAQVLSHPEHGDLAHSLRAALDIRKAGIKVIFAGSSEGSLRRMFSRPKEPFYNWAPIESFVLLGESFVRALVTKVNELTRFRLHESKALAAFDALRRTPEYFRAFLDRYLSHANLGSEAALEPTCAEVLSNDAFQQTWSRLLPADQSVLKLLAEGETDMYCEATR